MTSNVCRESCQGEAIHKTVQASWDSSPCRQCSRNGYQPQRWPYTDLSITSIYIGSIKIRDFHMTSNGRTACNKTQELSKHLSPCSMLREILFFCSCSCLFMAVPRSEMQIYSGRQISCQPASFSVTRSLDLLF